MGVYEVQNTLMLRVEAGSRVIISDEQYRLAREYLVPITDGTQEQGDESMLYGSSMIDGVEAFANQMDADDVRETEKAVLGDEQADVAPSGNDKLLSAMTKVELTDFAAEKGIKVTTSMSKADIVDLLENQVV